MAVKARGILYSTEPDFVSTPHTVMGFREIIASGRATGGIACEVSSGFVSAFCIAFIRVVKDNVQIVFCLTQIRRPLDADLVPLKETLGDFIRCHSEMTKQNHMLAYGISFWN